MSTAAATWTPPLRERLAKLLAMLAGADGEAANASRLIARDFDLNAVADFVRNGDPPGANDAMNAACRPFLGQALAEIQNSAWVLKGEQRSDLKSISQHWERGLQVEEVRRLWSLLQTKRRAVGKQ